MINRSRTVHSTFTRSEEAPALFESWSCVRARRRRRKPQQARGGLSTYCQMVQAALPTLPSDVLSHIACAALTAEWSTEEARIRLSLVCRAWRDGLRGAQHARCTG